MNTRRLVPEGRLLILSMFVLMLASCGSGVGRWKAVEQVTADTTLEDGRVSDADGAGETLEQDGANVVDNIPTSDAADAMADADAVQELDSADIPDETHEIIEPPKPLVAEAGFIEIEPVDFVVRNGWQTKSYTSSKARIWYAFQPADTSPETKPLAIFFNGGPGSATSLLFGYNTSKFTVDPLVTLGEPFAENPNSWTTFANVLYVDARETGFSYNVMEAVYLKANRKSEFNTKNFNSLLDGADFVRVLLRFLERHPLLQANPVLIVGESYGGIRATVMSYLLLNYSEMGEGDIVYEDQALAQEIQTHLETVFPDQQGARVPRELIASQFGHMALIQPLISGDYQSEVAGQMFRQAGSIIYQVAEQTGTTYEPCLPSSYHCDDENTAIMFVYEVAVRDLYNVSQPLGWMDDAGYAINKLLVQPDLLSQLLQIDITTIPELFNVNRIDGYRWGEIPDLPFIELPPSPTPSVPKSSVPNPSSVPEAAPKAHRVRAELAKALAETPEQLPIAARLQSARAKLLQTNKFRPEPSGLEIVFGFLRNWDQFFVPLHEAVNRTFYLSDADTLHIEPYDTMYGEMFLYDIRYIKTFVTRAAFDIVIYAPAIPEALCMHEDLVSACDYQPGESDQHLGTIQFSYLPGAFGSEEGPTTATVLFPTYSSSGHPVEVTEPELLLQDVLNWYSEETP